MTLQADIRGFGLGLAQTIRDFKDQLKLIQADETRTINKGDLRERVGVDDLHVNRRPSLTPYRRAILTPLAR